MFPFQSYIRTSVTSPEDQIEVHVNHWLLLTSESEEIKMSTKLKRTPLFGQDGHLGIPIIANNNKHKLQVSSRIHRPERFWILYLKTLKSLINYNLKSRGLTSVAPYSLTAGLMTY